MRPFSKFKYRSSVAQLASTATSLSLFSVEAPNCRIRGSSSFPSLPRCFCKEWWWSTIGKDNGILLLQIRNPWPLFGVFMSPAKAKAEVSAFSKNFFVGSSVERVYRGVHGKCDGWSLTRQGALICSTFWLIKASSDRSSQFLRMEATFASTDLSVACLLASKPWIYFLETNSLELLKKLFSLIKLDHFILISHTRRMGKMSLRKKVVL